MASKKKSSINYSQLIDEMYDLKIQKAEIEKQYEKRRAILAKAFDATAAGNALSSENHVANCSRILQIDYDVEALEHAGLSKEILNQIIKKEIIIVDYPGLVGILKKAGIPPGELKKRIQVIKEADKAKIVQLVDTQQLDIKDIKGCYHAQISKRIIIT